VGAKKLPGEKEARLEFIKEFRARNKTDGFLKGIASEVRELCAGFPIP